MKSLMFVSLSSFQKAGLWMSAWAVSFSSSMMINKSLCSAEGLPVAFVVLGRCFFGLMVIVPFLYQQRQEVLQTTYIGWHLLRGFFVAGAMLCTYTAYRYLPAHTAATLGSSGPLFTILCARLFLKETMTRSQWACVLMGYCGVLFIVRPDQFSIDFFAACSLLANFMGACAITVARFLSLKQEGALRILFYGSIVPFLCMISMVFFFPLSMSGIFVIAVALMGMLGVISQMCFIQALKLAPASYLAPFEYLRLCLIIPFGWFFFAEVPTTLVLCGAGMIVLSTLFLSLSSNKL